MRHAALFLLLLGTVAASAQPTIGPEIQSELLRPKQAEDTAAAPAVALAADRFGVAIAWTMANADGNDRIFAARLTPGGHVSGSIRQLPLSVSGKRIQASFPTLAPAPPGTGFTIAWRERSDDGWVELNAYALLDETLQPATPVTLPVRASGAPAISSSATGTWLAGGGQVWQLDAGGLIVSQHPVGEGVGDISAGEDYPRLAAAFRGRDKFTCRRDPGCTSGFPFNGYCFENCRIYEDAYRLRLITLPRGTGETTFPYASDAKPAIEADAKGMLMVWFHGAQNSGGEVLAVRVETPEVESWPVTGAIRALGTFPRDAGPTRPDIATDGERYVVVWRTRISTADHDIAGVSIEPDGSLTPLAIATSAADERDPAVVAVGNGKFLVGYEKLENGERRVAGKFVTLCCGRRRAVH
ncbi:MAG TPA: hypothetical protein VEK57_22665 [Thermoanaerobaculia bacterium]|nr:hypothetical protein [Thermoanaerobaculia bacterium]